MICRLIFLGAIVTVTMGGTSPNATTIDTCNLSSPCISGTNSGVGSGVFGSSAKGRGVSGFAHFNSTSLSNAMYGVYGVDLSTSGRFDGGVFGESMRGYGMYGVSNSGYGVYGTSTSSYGVFGNSAQYAGVLGTGPIYGVYGTTGSSSGSGIYGVNSGGGYAVHGYSPGTNGTGVFAQGNAIGLLVQSTNGHLISAVDHNFVQVFYVDQSGNIGYHGTLTHFVSIGAGHSIVQYTPSSTRPALEDTGTARLIYGSATVRFDQSFARSINPARPYQVFLTPGGDTRGLYIGLKTPSGFVVREVQGGHGTFTFDYHVYAASK